MGEMRYGCVTIRELLKRIVADWRTKGKHRRRGATLPPFDAFQNHVQTLFTPAAEAVAANND